MTEHELVEEKSWDVEATELIVVPGVVVVKPGTRGRVLHEGRAMVRVEFEPDLFPDKLNVIFCCPSTLASL
jgi:hypothetical protein